MQRTRYLNIFVERAQEHRSWETTTEVHKPPLTPHNAKCDNKKKQRCEDTKLEWGPSTHRFSQFN